MNRQLLKGCLFVFLGACSFGFLSTVTKTAYTYNYTVGEITGVQNFFGVLFLWLFFLFQKIFAPQSLKTTEPQNNIQHTPKWKIILAGTFTGLVGIFYYKSIKLLPASVAIILLMQYLWMTIIIEKFVFKRNPHKTQLIATAFVIIGTVFASGVLDTSMQINLKGVAFGLLAAFAYSIFLLTSGRIGTTLPVLKKSALIVTGSWLITWLIFPPTFFFNGIFFSGLYKWGIILAIMGTTIPPLFFSIGIPKIGVSLAAIISAVELPAAILAAYVVLHENVTPWRWLGVLMIIFAIIGPNIKQVVKSSIKKAG